MTAYAAEWADALADISAAGAPVVFTAGSPGPYNRTDGSFAGASAPTVAGSAMRVRGDPKIYETLKLVQTEIVTLLFAPSVFPAVLPALDSTVVWNGLTYIVKSVDPLALDGPAILARIIVAR